MRHAGKRTGLTWHVSICKMNTPLFYLCHYASMSLHISAHSYSHSHSVCDNAGDCDIPAKTAAYRWKELWQTSDKIQIQMLLWLHGSFWVVVTPHFPYSECELIVNNFCDFCDRKMSFLHALSVAAHQSKLHKILIANNPDNLDSEVYLHNLLPKVCAFKRKFS